MTPGTGDAPLPSRVGVVGAGLISAYHLDALAALEDAPVEAIVATRPERAVSAAARYGAPHALTDWRDLRGLVDVAIIATPDDTHADLARALIAEGIAVMVQKPLAASLADAAALVADSPPHLISASFMHRHLDATVALEAVLRSGALGEIMSARIRNATPGPDWGGWFYQGNGPMAGVVGQLGVHGIDLVEHLLGRITSVQAMTATRMPLRTMRDGEVIQSSVPDHALAHYRLANGVLVSHEQCWAEAGGTERFAMEVHGTEASAVLRTPSSPIGIHWRSGEWQALELDREPVLGFRHHRAWIDSVRRGADDGTARDAVRGLHVAEIVGQAAREQRTIELPGEERGTI
ncbi:Gfo/Idh/MocA family oxidoreductase [Agromyces fucosus]|jgi:predicted dehydrogenase|uniref:Gfo/Idh/MocA family oxidoreductase n=1 Tax=Agromyces fucosus TaxID=41985 RepID=A0A4Q2JPC7_9MICO|nr:MULTISPECIES: Gfo/Idh/MocA family oxidoreductase [Agromyces]KQZ10793.1 hypothetical protein ASD23_01095 [Agromyces sp. Root1464]RXZ48706.1 Gfo/Idh/MocA family oxidoreductase [Agromyces fucosus]